MPDMNVLIADLWLAANGRSGNGMGPLQTLDARPGIPNTAAYVLLKLKRKALAELADIDTARQKLCADLAVKNADGTPKMLEDGRFDIADMAAFQEGFNALLQQEVTLTGVRKIKVSEFGTANITVGEMDCLGPFLDDSTDDIAATA